MLVFSYIQPSLNFGHLLTTGRNMPNVMKTQDYNQVIESIPKFQKELGLEYETYGYVVVLDLSKSD